MKIEEILYKLAKKAYRMNEIPVSAVIVKDNKIIAKAYNKKNLVKNALYHAEILCLFKAYKKLKRWNLSDCKMYVTLEPCDLCKLAIQESRISNVYYILAKGHVTNFYRKTKYEQMYVLNNNYKKMFNSFFEKVRNK